MNLAQAEQGTFVYAEFKEQPAAQQIWPITYRLIPTQMNNPNCA